MLGNIIPSQTLEMENILSFRKILLVEYLTLPCKVHSTFEASGYKYYKI